MANPVVLAFAERMADAHKKADRAFGSDKRLEKKLAKLISAKMRNGENISYYELNTQGLLGPMEQYLGRKIKGDGLSPETVSLINDDLLALKVYDKSDTLTLDGVDKITIKLDDLGVTGDPAKKLAKALKDEFGIEKAGKNGISHEDALQLNQAIEKSDVFNNLRSKGTRKTLDPENFTRQMDLLLAGDGQVSLESLSKQLGINLDIDAKMARTLFGSTSGGIGRTEPLTEDQITILKDYAKSHQIVSKLGLDRNAKKTLDQRVSQTDSFLRNDSAPLRKAVIKQQGITSKQMDFLRQHAEMSKTIERDSLENLRYLVTDPIDNHKAYLLNELGIKTEEADKALRAMIDSHLNIRDQLKPEKLDELIAHKADMDPLTMKEYFQDDTDRNSILARRKAWEDATNLATAAGLDEIKENHPVIQKTNELMQDPAKFIENMAAQNNIDLDVLKQAMQVPMQNLPHIDPNAIPAPQSQSPVQTAQNKAIDKAQEQVDRLKAFAANPVISSKRQENKAIKAMVKNYSKNDRDDLANKLGVTNRRFRMKSALVKAAKEKWNAANDKDAFLDSIRQTAEAPARTHNL